VPESPKKKSRDILKTKLTLAQILNFNGQKKSQTTEGENLC